LNCTDIDRLRFLALLMHLANYTMSNAPSFSDCSNGMS